jgi:hypothetical protein
MLPTLNALVEEGVERTRDAKKTPRPPGTGPEASEGERMQWKYLHTVTLRKSLPEKSYLVTVPCIQVHLCRILHDIETKGVEKPELAPLS